MGATSPGNKTNHDAAWDSHRDSDWQAASDVEFGSQNRDAVTVTVRSQWLQVAMTVTGASLAVYIYVSIHIIYTWYMPVPWFLMGIFKLYTLYIPSVHMLSISWGLYQVYTGHLKSCYPPCCRFPYTMIYWYNNVMWFHATSFMLMYPNGSHTDLHIWMDQILVQAIKCRPCPSKTSWIVQMCWPIKCRIKGSNNCQGIKYCHRNQMQVNINRRPVELFKYGWNQSHAGWNDYIEDESINYRLNQSNAGWRDPILS